MTNFRQLEKSVPDLNEVAFSTHTRTNLGEDVWYRAKALWQFRNWSLNTQDPPKSQRMALQIGISGWCLALDAQVPRMYAVLGSLKC